MSAAVDDFLAILNGAVDRGEQPEWICHSCGKLYGMKEIKQYSTWHAGHCDVCGSRGPVTEPRDYGYLRSDWRGRNE